jgi:histidinol-phosphate aminotransferase
MSRAASTEPSLGPSTGLEPDLSHHGDRELEPGLLDLAVNVRAGAPPRWLRDELAGLDLARYPDATKAVAAVAARHGRDPAEVLVTAGAAEAFVLIARALQPREAVVVHPQFTEPEAALRAAGHPVRRCVLEFPFVLDPALIPESADLVMVGNPTNPTSRCHPAELLAALARPGRVLVVDEAFADCVPGEPDSLAGPERAGGLPGLVVLRSLTKTWGLAGLRAGYLLGEPAMITTLRSAQPLWAVSTPALAATVACCRPAAVAEADRWAHDLADDRDYLLSAMSELSQMHQLRVVPESAASFVLIEAPGHRGAHAALRDRGLAVRRGDSFPGLGPTWLRVAVRDRATTDLFVHALKEILR